MSDDQVLPCPFCGGEADIDAPVHRGSERLVYCKGCFASICEDSTPNVIAAWNRRPIQPQGAASPQGATVDAEAAEGTPASSGSNEREALSASLPALLLQAVEALEAIAVTEPICAAAYQDAMRIAAALRQRLNSPAKGGA